MDQTTSNRTYGFQPVRAGARPPAPQRSPRKPSGDLKIAAISAISAVVLIALLIGAFDTRASRANPATPTKPNVFTLEPSPRPTTPAPAPAAQLPAHVFRGTDGKLYAEPGYLWISAEQERLEVRWTAGLTHPTFANIRSAPQEGFWNADPGYIFPSKESLAVQWSPGRPHPQHPHVEAGPLPAQWRASLGYAWARPNDPNSFEVVSVIAAPRPVAPRVSSGPTQAQMEAAAGKLLISLLAHAASEEIDSKNLIQDLVKEGLKELRNEAVKSALTDLFPREPRLALEGAANILLLAVDGELSFGNWRSETTRDALALMLEKKSPSLSNTYQVADFIATVAEANRKRRR